MPRPCWSITAILLALLLAVPVQAGIYRWVDDDGVVQYADNPPAGVDAELVSPDSGIADTVEDPEPPLASDEDGDADDNGNEMPRTLDEYCDEVRAQLDILDSEEQVGMTTEDGEMQPLSEDERATHREALQEQLDQNC